MTQTNLEKCELPQLTQELEYILELEQFHNYEINRYWKNISIKKTTSSQNSTGKFQQDLRNNNNNFI